jgi:hypothetical protein|uniref:HNH endonuclease n=1 Tax=uncultured bacterium Contigcl_10-cl TaxID=1393643 RepID=W0FKX8_9BACT|nr:HNH endonuclease [uncultured bacterium Contigcl_10-cl]
MHSTSATTLLAADQRAWNDVVGAIDLAERIVARAEAERMRALAAAGRLVRDLTADTPTRVREHDMVLRSLSAEIGAVARRSDRSVQRDIGDAIELVEHYPATLSRWEAGDITRAHVRTIVDCGAIVPIDARADFDKDAAALATHHSPGRLRRLLEQLADDMHPRSLVERHVDARAERCVRVVARGEGMSDLIVTTPTLLADAVYDRLTQQARVLIDTRAHVDAGADVGAHSCVDAADTRSIDQVRADLVTDMLLTVAPSADPTRTDDGPGALGAIRAKVQIVVPVATLLGDDDRSAELAGRSPLDADTARRLAGATRCPWERVLTHPITGQVLAVDTYQRPAALDRYLRARDQHCRFPGCRVPAVRCEVDHTTDWALGGKTEASNLAHLCQRHHSMKQFTAWTVRQHPGGILEWTSPGGRIYLDHPAGAGAHAVTFTPDPPGDTGSRAHPRHDESTAPF